MLGRFCILTSGSIDSGYFDPTNLHPVERDFSFVSFYFLIAWFDILETGVGQRVRVWDVGRAYRESNVAKLLVAPGTEAFQ